MSPVEVSHISTHGIWLYVEDKEYFLNYKSYPWFKDATVSQIHQVKLLRGNHLRWKALDIDLELDAIQHPEQYPLIYKK